jgi:four helix bundle protein
MEDLMDGPVKRFEDLNVWKESMKLAIDLYKCLKDCKDFGFRDQIQRSAVSIPSNIAEGFERNSNKEYIQFLYIAKASCAELRTQLYLGMEIEILDKSEAKGFIEKTKKISAMLVRLIQTGKQNF